jgi:S-DNA-T family DNA segregation ATPase FtsK/SpoIIIE
MWVYYAENAVVYRTAGKMGKVKEKNAETRLRAMHLFGLAVCVLLICSCLSFDIGDVPSKYVWPHNSPPQNWCGTAGAFTAYYLMYYIGPGVFVLLGCAGGMLISKLFGRDITQPILRAVGLLLLTAAVSTSYYLLRPVSENGFPAGTGGVIGIAAGVFLKSHLAALGTGVVVVSTWIVGAILLADSVLIAVGRALVLVFSGLFGIAGPAWSAAKKRSKDLSEIWRKLSSRQKRVASQVSMAARRAIKMPIELRERPEVEGRQARPLRVAVPEVGPAVPRPGGQAADRQTGSYQAQEYEDYTLPGLELLAEPERGLGAVQEKVVKAKAASVEKLLGEFGINARVVAAETGPVITMFELELAAGIKVSQISNLANDMARALGAPAVRVVAPLPGKHTIGIEVPNSQKEKVRMKDVLQLAGGRAQRMQIPLFLGKDSAGEALVSDLAAMPHLLIAGTTGSGKSVCINSIVSSILLTKRPDEVKLILLDPKMVEMTAFAAVPHLMCPIVTEIKRAEQILEWATVKMDERYALLAETKVKNVTEYNGLSVEELLARLEPGSAEEEAQIPKRLPHIVIVIDELADLMMTAAKEIEAYVVRLAQKSRAIGIHLVLATQRPQATVVTGLIKSNLPTRISFRVAARMDSRIILDQNGAETLMGQGDLLFLQPGTSELVRAQGTFVDETELRRVVKHLKQMAEPQFHPELTQLNKIDPSELGKDELFDDAARIVLETQRGSVSLLQRRLGVGYARASRMIEMMAALGILGEHKGSQAREVMMTLSDYEAMRERMQETQSDEYEDGAEEREDKAVYKEMPSEGVRGYASVRSETD